MEGVGSRIGKSKVVLCLLLWFKIDKADTKPAMVDIIELVLEASSMESCIDFVELGE